MNDKEQSTERAVNAIQRSPERTTPKTYRDGNQCVRIKRNGERCQKAPILGGTVCRFHGGAAKHVKLAAKARLENAADRLAQQLLGMAMDESMKPETRLAAIKDALDRAGLSPRQAVDVVHEMKPWERILDRAWEIDRAGAANALLAPPTVVDGEVVEDYADFSDGREA